MLVMSFFQRLNKIFIILVFFFQVSHVLLVSQHRLVEFVLDQLLVHELLLLPLFDHCLDHGLVLELQIVLDFQLFGQTL
jgi:hypothetical protein